MDDVVAIITENSFFFLATGTSVGIFLIMHAFGLFKALGIELRPADFQSGSGGDDCGCGGGGGGGGD